jgi:hypothetical protein
MIFLRGNRDSSVGIVTRLRARRTRNLDSRHEKEIFTGSGAHPASYRVGSGALSPGVKGSRREADHSPASSAEVKNGGAILPPYISMAWCLTN